MLIKIQQNTSDSVSVYRAATCEISAVYGILGGLCRVVIVGEEARYEEKN